MNYKVNFKGINRRINKIDICSFTDLQSTIQTLFPQSKNHADLEYFYVDSDNDEVTMLNDEDVEIMKQDCGQDENNKKAIKICVKTRIDILASKTVKKDKDCFIIDDKTGDKIKFESSEEFSRSRSLKGMNSKERKLKRIQKNILKSKA
jgi:PB1 domain